MPAVLALPLFWGAVGATAGAAGIAYGAHESSQASEQATQATSQSNAAAIAEQQKEDAQQKAEFDAQQAALTNQWNAQQAIRAPYRAAGQTALSKVGDILGVNFNSGNSPSYAAPAAPTAATAPAAGTPATAPTSGSGNPLDMSAINGELAKNYQSLGVQPTGPGTGPTDAAYYAAQIAKTGGLTPQNTSYWFGPNGRIATDLAKAQSGASGSTPISAVMPPTSLAPSSLAMPPSNPLAPSYGAVVPISSMMGGAA